MKLETIEDSLPEMEPPEAGAAGSRYVAVSRWDGVRWFLATLLVIACLLYTSPSPRDS